VAFNNPLFLDFLLLFLATRHIIFLAFLINIYYVCA
jgi:hypothetical protein